MKPRTRARAVALQVLYEIDIVDHLPGEALQQRLEESKLADNLAEFSRQIVFGVIPLREILDTYIAEHASDWPLDQVATIDRNVLRIALWEIAVYSGTPIKVAINEAIELAKMYGSDSASRFVNGVLGALAERENEIKQRLIKAIAESGAGTTD